MTHPWVMDNNFVKYPDPTWQWRVMARTQIMGTCMCDLDFWDMTLGQGHDTSLGHGQQLYEIYPDSICPEGKKLLPGHDVNRRTKGRTDRETDRQTERVILNIPLPQTLFAGGINIINLRSVQCELNKFCDMYKGQYIDYWWPLTVCATGNTWTGIYNDLWIQCVLLICYMYKKERNDKLLVHRCKCSRNTLIMFIFAQFHYLQRSSEGHPVLV